MSTICHQIEEPPIKPASWTLQNFGGWPKSLKWSSQSRPMTDLVRKSRPKTSRQPSLFLSLQILEVAGSNLYCEPAPPAFSTEVPVRTCTANRLHRFTGSPTYAFRVTDMYSGPLVIVQTCATMEGPPVLVCQGACTGNRIQTGKQDCLLRRFETTLPNKMGHGTILGRPFQGFRAPIKILQVQDAGFIDNSSS